MAHIHKRDIIHWWGTQTNMAEDLTITRQALTRWTELSDRQVNELVGAAIRHRRITYKQARDLFNGEVS